jgi:hypothetical protein
MAMLAAKPELTVNYPEGLVYHATEAAELGALDALTHLKLSPYARFADKAGGCGLAQSALAATIAWASPAVVRGEVAGDNGRCADPEWLKPRPQARLSAPQSRHACGNPDQ